MLYVALGNSMIFTDNLNNSVHLQCIYVTYLPVEPDEKSEISSTALAQVPLDLRQWSREHGEVRMLARFSIDSRDN